MKGEFILGLLKYIYSNLQLLTTGYVVCSQATIIPKWQCAMNVVNTKERDEWKESTRHIMAGIT
jgi:hypothetical protein